MSASKSEEPISLYQKHYTYADYIEFTFDEMVEIIKGKLVKMSPAPSTLHQKISMALSAHIYNVIKNHSCEVFSAPFDVVLPVKGKAFEASDRVVQPDICVICDSEKIKPQACFGAPDWIVEILSPSTTKKDVQDKFQLYEESKVKEYWIVEPRNRTVEVFVLQDDVYRRVQTYVEGDEAPSHTIEGLSIELNAIFP